MRIIKNILVAIILSALLTLPSSALVTLTLTGNGSMGATGATGPTGPTGPTGEAGTSYLTREATYAYLTSSTATTDSFLAPQYLLGGSTWEASLKYDTSSKSTILALNDTNPIVEFCRESDKNYSMNLPSLGANPIMIFRSKSQVRNRYGFMGIGDLLGVPTYFIVASASGDDIDGTPKVADGMPLYFFSGDGGNLFAGGNGGDMGFNSGSAKGGGNNKAGNITFTPGTPTGTGLRGSIINAGFVKFNQGLQITATTEVSISTGNFYDVTGAATIEGISNAIFSGTDATVINLRFIDASPGQLKHNGTVSAGYSKLRLAGSLDFAPSQYSNITLVYRYAGGTVYWEEIARTVF